jgi:hypothetical protein
MHWFGELLAFYIAIAAAGFAILYARKFPAYRAQRRAAELEYTTRAGWRRTWQKLEDANASAIDAIARGMAPGFPDDVRDEMLAAHQAASETRGNRS